MAAEPRVEDLLASIRKAMDQDIAAKDDTKSKSNESAAPQQGSMMQGALREMRVAYERAEQPAGIRTSKVEPLRARIAVAANDIVEAQVPTHGRKSAPLSKLESVETERPKKSEARPFSGILSGAIEQPSQSRSPQFGEPPPLRPSQHEASYSEDVVYEAPPPEPLPHIAPLPHLAPRRVVREETHHHSAREQELHTEAYPPREAQRYADTRGYLPPEQPAYPAPPSYTQEPSRYAEPQWPRAGALMSPQSAQSTRHSFEELAETLLSKATSERMFEDMTRDMLRGMLRQWLDENLPGIVEKMVREEIERVARRGR